MAKLSTYEHELEQERDALRANLTRLGHRGSPTNLVDTASDLAARHGGEVLGQASRLARRNKGPLALTGIGLGWLALKLANGSTNPVAYDARTTPAVEGFRRDPDDGSFDRRVAAATAANPGRFGTETLKGETEMTYHPDTTTTQTTLTDRAYGKVADLRAKIEDGLDGLPDDAKARVRQAREAAITAQSEIQDRAERAVAATRQTAHENPLLVGAFAFAAGAALAAALPRTSVENNAIGAHRDRLFDEADRVMRDEMAKVKSGAETLVRDGQAKAKKAATDAVDSVSDAIGSKADMRGNRSTATAAE